jgi:general secretion pathway protein L
MAGEFLQWWGQQLRDCLPDALRRLWHSGQSTLLAEFREGQLLIRPPSTESSITVPIKAIDGGELPPSVTDALADLEPPERIDLTLPPGQFLIRDLTLPHAARPHLAETVGYQLSKVTPFSGDDAFFACGVKEEGNGNTPLKAWVVAIPKMPITAAMKLFGQAPPANPVRLQQPPEAGQSITVALTITRANDTQPSRWRLAWVGLLLAWLVAGGLHVYQRFDERAQLEAMLLELRTEAAEVVALRDRIDQATAQMSRLDDAKHNNPSSLVMLDELTTLLDDNTWLQRLDFDGEDLTLAGNASAPAALIEALEGSPTFDRVRFESLSRDERTATDRFRIRAHLESKTAEDTL